MTILLNNALIIALLLMVCENHLILIKTNRPIKHGWWALAYIIVISVFACIWGWFYLPMFLFLRGWLYSPALNVYRFGFKKWDYWSLTSTSILDKIERKVFKKFWIARLFYFIVWWVFIIIEIWK